MIIVKNAFRNMLRNKGRNFLIGIIITIITLCTCIALAIHQAGVNLVQTYKDTNPLSISFSLNMNVKMYVTSRKRYTTCNKPDKYSNQIHTVCWD